MRLPIRGELEIPLSQSIRGAETVFAFKQAANQMKKKASRLLHTKVCGEGLS
jgi:hypothetical protein